jgi:hypothetical protein
MDVPKKSKRIIIWNGGSIISLRGQVFPLHISVMIKQSYGNSPRCLWLNWPQGRSQDSDIGGARRTLSVDKNYIVPTRDLDVGLKKLRNLMLA